MNFFSKIKENPLLSLLIILLILLGIVFVVVLYFEDPKRIFNLLGVSKKEQPKYEALKFLGISMGGILVALQALMSYKRAKAMEETAKAQANAANAQADAAQAQARANENTEQGLRQERLKNAIEHLGHDSSSVRLGGAYELFHLAEDTEELRQTALDMLCLHIRQTTGESEYQEMHELKPSEEVQSLLTLLFVQELEVFKGLPINLQGSYLNGANLRNARLAKAVLSGAYLQGADLQWVHLQRANLGKAYLQGANLSMSHLQGANLNESHLQGANLRMSRLQGANLGWSHLQGANLGWSHLQGADLSGSHLQGANLRWSHLQGADLSGSHLQGADLSESHLQGAGSAGFVLFQGFVDSIRDQIGKESDLSDLLFEGGLSWEDLDSLLEGLSEEKTNELREKLEPHIDQPMSYGLPEDSGAITGAYTKEEAEEWIAEYEKAMSEVPKDDS